MPPKALAEEILEKGFAVLFVDYRLPGPWRVASRASFGMFAHSFEAASKGFARSPRRDAHKIPLRNWGRVTESK